MGFIRSLIADRKYDIRETIDTPWEIPEIISCGQYHCTALKADGSLVSWGRNLELQVSDTPIGNDFVQVSCGTFHCTALKADGSLVSWGSNSNTVVTTTPIGNDFVQVSCGQYHCTALKADGSLVSWGHNTYNQVTSTPIGNDFLLPLSSDISISNTLVNNAYINKSVSKVELTSNISSNKQNSKFLTPTSEVELEPGIKMRSYPLPTDTYKITDES